jgi:uncharacterized repeat protein (TIGR01451 family)
MPTAAPAPSQAPPANADPFPLPTEMPETSPGLQAAAEPMGFVDPAAAPSANSDAPPAEATMPTIEADSAPAFSLSFTGLEEGSDKDVTEAPAATEPAPAAKAPAEATPQQLSTQNTLRTVGNESPAPKEANETPTSPAAEGPAANAPYQFQPAEVATLQPLPESSAPAVDAEADSADAAARPMDGGFSPALDARPVEAPGQPAPGNAGPAGEATGEATGQAVTAASATASPSGLSMENREMAPAASPEARVASRDPATLSALPNLESVSAAPGERRLDGAQAPSVIIHKRAPEEVNVGKPATFVIQVQNVGTTDALNVRVFDRVPRGMRLVDATPTPERQQDLLTWSLGALEPGGERSLTMQLIPEAEGELGSVARVTFEAAASVRTISTRPELKITQRAPEKVLIGQQLEIEILIENVGSGAATDVVLQEDVPEGLEHPKGRQLDNLIGTLAPGESRSQTLRLRATAAGTIQNIVELVAQDGLTAKDSVAVQVVAPQLAVDLQGPSRRYLERQATYDVSIANQGTATANDVSLIAYLDRGLTFVSTDFEGQYDPARHAVYWSLAELPAGQEGLVPLTLLPIEEGEQAVRLEANAALGMRAESEKSVTVDTLAELTFAVVDDQDPIETASETTYEIRVANAGTRDDTNVQLRVQLPPGMELQSADRKAGTDNQGMVVFEPLERIAPQQEEVFRLRVLGREAGTHVIKAILTSDQAPVAVTKEESTRVYADQ